MMILLTRDNGSPIFVNVNQIVWFEQDVTGDAKTVIQFNGGHGHAREVFLRVRQPTSEVAALCAGASA